MFSWNQQYNDIPWTGGEKPKKSDYVKKGEQTKSGEWIADFWI